MPLSAPYLTRNAKQLTSELALDLEEFLALRVFAEKGCVQRNHLLADVEELLALCVHEVFAAGDGENFAFDLKHHTAVYGFDAEGVAGEREDSFFEDEGFGLLGDELRVEDDRSSHGEGRAVFTEIWDWYKDERVRMGK